MCRRQVTIGETCFAPRLLHFLILIPLWRSNGTEGVRLFCIRGVLRTWRGRRHGPFATTGSCASRLVHGRHDLDAASPHQYLHKLRSGTAWMQCPGRQEEISIIPTYLPTYCSFSSSHHHHQDHHHHHRHGLLPAVIHGHQAITICIFNDAASHGRSFLADDSLWHAAAWFAPVWCFLYQTSSRSALPVALPMGHSHHNGQVVHKVPTTLSCLIKVRSGKGNKASRSFRRLGHVRRCLPSRHMKRKESTQLQRLTFITLQPPLGT
ncbi:hypothetical protein B0T22DRAFT_111547 [Podospora appendiculata]|uniref:Secreted protein n=1 Tax=Podospora appendiculata TaxID=314037 RepID=A0AAE0XLL1_9PEZI|nr:hypothetical protein B0T22DRAFT_111547 [Podospora appendiculata]